MPDATEWRFIPGYEDLYMISSIGEVVSLNYKRRSHGQRKYLKQTLHPNGYLHVHLSGPCGRKVEMIHRLVVSAFLGATSTRKIQVNHISGVKTDNRLENLELCSPSKNTKHAYEHGLLIPRHGESHRNAKLSLEKIAEAKELLATGKSQRDVAHLLGVAQSQSSRAVNGKRWVRAMNCQRVSLRQTQ